MENQEPKEKEKRTSESHVCGFCSAGFPTMQELYEHQQKEHDPDGIMFSEIGLPK